jgi:hypothetical protein
MDTEYSRNHLATATKLRTDTPLSAHPDMLSVERPILDVPGTEGEKIYLLARQAHKLVTETLGQLIDTRKAILAESKTPHAREMGPRPDGLPGEALMQKFPDESLPAYRAACQAAFDRVAVGIQKAIDEAESGLGTLNKQVEASLFDSSADTISGSTIANSIREHCKGLTKTPNARFNFVMDAIKKGDRTTVAAILSGPAYLSGLTDDQHTGLRKAAERVFSKACAQRDAAQKALDRLNALPDMFIKEHSKLVPKARVTKAQLPIQAMLEKLKNG